MAGQKYDPVGKCIYCGSLIYSKAAPHRTLAEEHIIPLGLVGLYVLPEASCRECETITGRQDSKLLRGPLWACRTHLLLPTRRPKERPKELPVWVDGEKKMVKIEEYPAFLMFPKFPPPRILNFFAPPTLGVRGKVFSYDREALEHRYGVHKFEWPALDSLVVQRVIAKIAHSYAVAKLGIDGFVPCLTHFIRDESAKGLLNLIGCVQDDEPETEHMHSLSIMGEVGDLGLVVVRVRLFGNFKMPTYLAVVGTKSGYAPILDAWKTFDSEQVFEIKAGI